MYINSNLVTEAVYNLVWIMTL